jgi:hypothetical protein
MRRSQSIHLKVDTATVMQKGQKELTKPYLCVALVCLDWLMQMASTHIGRGCVGERKKLRAK